MTPSSAQLPEPTDEVLMASLQSGQNDALDTLMSRWERPLRAFLFRYTGNEHDALDLAQEAFVRVHLHRQRFRTDARFSTWLFQIALNLARDHARHRARRPTAPLDAAPEPATTQTPHIEALAAERAAAVRNAIAGLPDDLREAVLLFEYQDKSHAEIATIVGATAKAVETRLYRARHLLRTALSRFLQDPAR